MSSNPIKRDFSKNQIKILKLLFEKEYLQNELQEALNTTAPNLHYHLSHLERHNLIKKETLHDVGSAKINRVSLNPSAREYIQKLLGYENKKSTRNNASNIPNLLKKLLAAIPEVKATAIISAEGLPIASALPQGVDETRIAAMTAALLSLSERAIIEMRKGDFDHLFIKGSEGYLLVTQIGPNAVLVKSDDDDGDDDDDDRYPYPYIFKPPEPPGDLGVAPQLQVKKSMDKEPENEIYCQYCGRKLRKEDRFSHNCRKSPE